MQRTVIGDPKASLRPVGGNIQSLARTIFSRGAIAAAATRLRASRRSEAERQDQDLEAIHLRRHGREADFSHSRGRGLLKIAVDRSGSFCDWLAHEAIPPVDRNPPVFAGEMHRRNMMKSVVHFEMPFDDRDRMTKFYELAFGWRTQKLGEDMGSYVLATTTETDDHSPRRPARSLADSFRKSPVAPLREKRATSPTARESQCCAMQNRA